MIIVIMLLSWYPGTDMHTVIPVVDGELDVVVQVTLQPDGVGWQGHELVVHLVLRRFGMPRVSEEQT